MRCGSCCENFNPSGSQLATVAAIVGVTLLVLNCMAINGDLNLMTISCINTAAFGATLIASLILMKQMSEGPDQDNKILAAIIGLAFILTLVGALGIGNVIHSPASVGWSVVAPFIAVAGIGVIVGGRILYKG